MRRRMAMLRKVLHVRGDVMCTAMLLMLFCILLYTHQVLLHSEWDSTRWKLEIQGSTNSNRALLGASGHGMVTGSREGQTIDEVSSSPANTKLPACKPQASKSQSKSKSPQSKSKSPAKSKKLPKDKSKGKVKEWRKNVVPTKAPGKALPTLPPFDFEGYLKEKDNREFKLLINQPEKCQLAGESSDAPYMLIVVKSVAADFDKRQVVRRTWGKEGLFPNGVTIRTVFLLGVPRNQSALPLWDRLLAYESETFNDILLWDFEDTFFNLTLKEIHFLQWVNTSCPDVRFIFKGDADVYVNVENILEMLQTQKADVDLFVGDIIFNAKPIRRRSSKYYIPEFIYGAGLYPSYAGGGGFVMSGHTARRLSSACEQVDLFPIDDVFLGMCLQRISLKPTRHEGFRTFGIIRPSAAPNLQLFNPCFYRELMVVHRLTPPQIWLMWRLLHDPNLTCHSRRNRTAWPFKWRGGGGGLPGMEGTTAVVEEAEETDYGVKKVFVSH